jgi:hypothetical protein
MCSGDSSASCVKIVVSADPPGDRMRARTSMNGEITMAAKKGARKGGKKAAKKGGRKKAGRKAAKKRQ